MANALSKILQTITLRAKQPKSLMPANTYGQFPFANWFSSVSKSGENVTEKTAKSLATYYACGRNMCEDIAKMPFITVKNEKNGNKTRLKNTQAYQLLNVKPNNYANPFDLIYTIFNEAIYRGNGYWYILRDGSGLPSELHYIDSNFVTPQFDVDTRSMWYLVNYPILNLNRWCSQDEIFHLKGPGNGMIGQSVISYQLETLGKALAVQDYSNNYFRDGASMSGLLSFAGVSDEKKLQTYVNMFMASFQKGGVGAVPDGVTFQSMNNDPQKSQFIETENQIRGEIARMFRMPLSKLQDLSDTNNNALEQVNINYVTDCLMPWIRRFEQESDRKLFAIYERDSLDGMFDTEVLLRGDSAAMERKARTMFMYGASTPNELRKMYGENTLDNEASNINYIPSNMMPASEAIPFWQKQSTITTTPTTTEPIGGQPQ
jgi:HK97 family phage portal protein